MAKPVDYYLSVASPWTFLGSERFIALARQSGAVVNVRPVDLGRVLAASGGLPFQQRPPQRASYRQEELARWRARLGIALELEPAFYPVDRAPASRMIIAARALGQDAALDLSHAVLRAIWQEQRDIADWPTLVELADACGLAGGALQQVAQGDAALQAYEADTRAAIEAQVFGAPTWVIDGQRYWGQDRLDFVAEALAANQGGR